MKLRSYKTQPESETKALEKLEKLKAEVGMKGVRSDTSEVRAILKRAGSLSEEILELRKQERT